MVRICSFFSKCFVYGSGVNLYAFKPSNTSSTSKLSIRPFKFDSFNSAYNQYVCKRAAYKFIGNKDWMTFPYPGMLVSTRE